jgi:hypothetical protein
VTPHGGCLTLSRWQLSLCSECPRCFWLVNRFGVKLPKSLPFALNSAIDGLLKTEFDAHRSAGTLPPILSSLERQATLFENTEQLHTWRNNFRGLRWTDPSSGHTLFGAVDDLLEFQDGALAVVDYKSTGSAAPTIYPSYQLQMDVYTYLLQRLGYRTAPKAYFAFFLVVKDDGFNGRLPFREQLVEVTPDPGRVSDLFAQAVTLAQADQPPTPGATCDLCRWYGETVRIVDGTRTSVPS